MDERVAESFEAAAVFGRIFLLNGFGNHGHGCSPVVGLYAFASLI